MNSTNPPSQASVGTRTALVLGASGSIGSAVAEALAARGWSVRALARDPDMALASWKGPSCAVEWRRGDAMVASDVLAAAQGTQVIVHAVNPPGYQNWQKMVLPMVDNTIAAARATGARILLPGTIYNYDPAALPVVHDDSAQHPVSRKGLIRVELERRLERASSEVPALIVRAGDFYGPKLRSSWFSQAMINQGQPVGRLRLLSSGVGHTWAYLPDLAEAMARLLEHPQLRPFERLGFEGFWDPDGSAFPALIASALGRASLPTSSFPWWLMRLLAPLGRFPREVMEIRPFWQRPVRIDNTRLVELLGAEPRTPPVSGMRTTLQGLGCMPGSFTDASTPQTACA
jgi:nucleoside-diphosphate-sugar epimerase